jgi:hypothetical protein
MLAVPYRAELRSRAIGSLFGLALAAVTYAGVLAIAGRLDDEPFTGLDAAFVAVAVLVGVAFSTSRRRRLHEQLTRPRQLPPTVDEAVAPRVRWATMVLRGVVGGLAFAGIALLIANDPPIIAIVIGVAVGGVLGDDVANALKVSRHEREHGGSVFRLEDPPGTEAGLGWLGGRAE